MKESASPPLYVRIREVLLHRIADGHWAPGERLPSEHELGEELGASQGTVRKALDALAAGFLVERRQGRGTYVTEKTPERSLFHFFRLTRADGARVAPEPIVETVSRRAATAPEAVALRLQAGSPVYEIARIRGVDDRPAAVETIVAPGAVVPGLETRGALPNALYSFYQAVYGVNITHAEDRMRAIAASPEDAEKLGIAAGAPLLLVERVAFDLTGRAVEWRSSRFLTEVHGYSVTLR